jgi:hypothetical protein
MALMKSIGTVAVPGCSLNWEQLPALPVPQGLPRPDP